MTTSEPSKTYHQIKNRLFFINLAFTIFILLIFFLGGLSLQLKNAILRFNQDFLIVNGLYAVFFGLFLTVLGLPLSFYEGFMLEHRFLLSNQSPKNWLKDFLKNSIISLIIILICVEALYIFLRKFPFTWWLWSAGFWLLLTVVLAKITPNVIIPLFFKYRLVENAQLKMRIFKLFEKCRVKIKDIYYINLSSKTKKANAFICGLGNNRRLVLSDTLLEKFEEPQISSVVAHELSHYIRHDLWKIILVNSAVSLACFFLLSRALNKMLWYFGFFHIDDIAFLPMLFLGIFLLGLVMLPLTNVFSRRLESEADLFSMQLTGDPENFISMIKKLGELNLADFSPSRFIEVMLYDHPPISKRIKSAEGYKIKNDL